ncbi:HNH endonuclease [Staphylococcus xylosus]|uniref:HNH endonuclease n=3 Tax=Staphylococcus xylosus TaxID=1288 RepID=UPI0008537838|nr:HNH endonuclease [Staphylococcus xylosus]OEK84004.1 hypothetical protein AST14_07815 [Staphylococcus xylosus]
MEENRKIPANSALFIELKNRYISEIKEFENYLKNLAKLNNNIKNKKSGKASSYANYLIRLVILYNEEFNEEILDITTIESVKKLEKLASLKLFQKLNSNENHFYSATLRSYKAYVFNLCEHKEEIESNLENRKTDYYASIKVSENDLIKKPQKRNKVNFNKGTYIRNGKEAYAAKQKSYWKCEYNPSHKTFTNNINKKPFVEAHHLVPMFVQSYFENTIDFVDNIVILCPNCHRKIHHGLIEERKEMIEKLFEKRKDKYKKYGINITLDEVLTFYSILD